MYTKQEASTLRQAFWTRFGQYMKPVLGAIGEPVNWLNYKTGIKGIFFRMDADREQASIAIEIRQADERLYLHYLEKITQLKSMLEETMGESWQWEIDQVDASGNNHSRIGITLNGVNIFNSNDWPAIISFLKPRIVALDAFWNLAKDLLEA